MTPPLVEEASCPAGHEQTYIRKDRPGRCVRCGSILQRAVYDDALPTGRTVSSPGSAVPKLMLDEEVSDDAN